MEWILDGRIRTFWVVAQHMSFTKAAAALAITQPAVSLQIRSLETALGTRVFKRSSSGLELTEVGSALLRHAEPLLTGARCLENEVATVSGVVRGTVGVAVSMAIGSYVLPAIVARFTRSHRGCTIETMLGNSRMILEHVADESVDVGIVSDPVERRDVVIEPFIEDEVVLIVAAGHRWAGRRTVDLDEVVREPFLVREGGSGTRKVLEAGLRKAGASLEELDVIATFGGFEAAKATVMLGVGITAAPSIAVHDDVRSGRLAIVRCPQLSMRRNFNIVYSKRSPVPERVSAFLDCARDVARSMKEHVDGEAAVPPA